MPHISTTISVHWSANFAASTTSTDGAPLQIACIGKAYEHGADIALYTYDQILTDRLVAAINEIVEARRIEVAATKQAAA